jgi:hypothetical protein
MPNPWDRQPRTVPIAAAAALPCPLCGQATESLKQYQYVRWMVFYLVGASWQQLVLRACPRCMRGQIVRRMVWNIVPANVLWVVLLLPWGLGLLIASRRKGHSPAVLLNITPAMVAAQHDAANEVSWGRVWVIVAVLFCWAPLFGPLLAGLAYFLNRHSVGWKRTASRIALGLSALIHIALVGLLVVEALNR